MIAALFVETAGAYFGHISGRKGLTHWLVFMSPNGEVRGCPPQEQETKA